MARVTNVVCELNAGILIDVAQTAKKSTIRDMIHAGDAKCWGRDLEINIPGHSSKAILRFQRLRLIERGDKGSQREKVLNLMNSRRGTTGRETRITITGETSLEDARSAAKRLCKKLEAWRIISDDQSVFSSFRVLSFSGTGDLGFKVAVDRVARRIPGASLWDDQFLDLQVPVTTSNLEDAQAVPTKLSISTRLSRLQATSLRLCHEVTVTVDGRTGDLSPIEDGTISS